MKSIWLDFLGERFSLAYYNAGGVRTRCLEAGSGPPLILLHGRSGHLENWIKNVMPLSRSCHVFAIDMLGHGFTAKPPLEYTIGDFASHLEAFIGTLGLKRVSLAGQSLGGWVAGWLAYKKPELVEKLVLVNTNGFKPILPESVSKIRQISLAAFDNLTLEGMIARLKPLVLDPSIINEEIARIRLKIYRQPEMRRVTEMVVGPELEPERQRQFELTPERLSRITAPTLVTWTTHEPLCSWEDADQIRRNLPHSSFHLLRECGHWPQFEQAEELNRVVSEFLAKS